VNNGHGESDQEHNAQQYQVCSLSTGQFGPDVFFGVGMAVSVSLV
jgi:hypothetical protein